MQEPGSAGLAGLYQHSLPAGSNSSEIEDTRMRTLLSTAFALALTAGVALTQPPAPGAAGAKGKAAPTPGMALSSPDFQDGGIIPDKFTQAVPMPVSPKLE